MKDLARLFPKFFMFRKHLRVINSGQNPSQTIRRNHKMQSPSRDCNRCYTTNRAFLEHKDPSRKDIRGMAAHSQLWLSLTQKRCPSNEFKVQVGEKAQTLLKFGKFSGYVTGDTSVVFFQQIWYAKTVTEDKVRLPIAIFAELKGEIDSINLSYDRGIMHGSH